MPKRSRKSPSKRLSVDMPLIILWLEPVQWKVDTPLITVRLEAVNLDKVQALKTANRMTLSQPPKNSGAGALGRLGGLKGHARAARVSKKRLSQIGKKGASARRGMPETRRFHEAG